jgi:GT2 family glycosyltransferase/glycosyltransferase involved in cell wall biosynthesis
VSPLILDDSEPLRTERGAIVVVIPVYGSHDRFVECIRSVLAHTPADIPVLVVDDASPDERSTEFLVRLDEHDAFAHTVYCVKHIENKGFVATANEAFELCDPADVIVLNSDCVVTEGWLEAMRSASEDSLVATVSVFTNSGTILSLPDRNRPAATLPQSLALDAVAQAIRDRSLRLRPRIPTAVGHCFLVTRRALDLVGLFDETFSPGYGEEVDFSQRCVARGLQHVVADDTFVQHAGSASFSSTEGRDALQHSHDRIINTRYPYYGAWVSLVSASRSDPLAYAIDAANRALRRQLSVTVDGRCLGPVVTGTQIHTLELTAALARREEVRVRAVVPLQLGDYARQVLSALPVEIVTVEAVVGGDGRTDVVHVPLQVSRPEDLALLDSMGDRIVMTQQDLIAYHNPRYFNAYDEWDTYRATIRLALAFADRVVFFSHSAANEAVGENLVDPLRSATVYIGTDHTLDHVPANERPPAGMEVLRGRPFLLCLGTDFAHKNRVFALRLLKSLQSRHGYGGGLVFAGPHVAVGSSGPEEAAFLALHPSIQDLVLDVAAVDEGEKRWLLRNATLMIYPSVHEGFGLIPFESAEAGLACAFASNTSISELLPSKLALIEQWSEDTTADRLAPYIVSADLRADHVAAVRAAGARFTWRATAERLVDVYGSAVDGPVAEVRKLASTPARVPGLGGLPQRLDPVTEGLLGPLGEIPPDLRRPLLAIAKRPALRRMVFGPIRAGYVAGYWLTHARRPPAD